MGKLRSIYLIVDDSGFWKLYIIKNILDCAENIVIAIVRYIVN